MFCRMPGAWVNATGVSCVDPFLSEHLEKYGGAGRESVKNVSSTTCDEFIELLANRVTAAIVNELKTAKYFLIIVDSTPDLSHTDQRCVVLRYVSKTGPKESFLRFVPIHSHTGEQQKDTVYKILEDKE